MRRIAGPHCCTSINPAHLRSHAARGQGLYLMMRNYLSHRRRFCFSAAPPLGCAAEKRLRSNSVRPILGWQSFRDGGNGQADCAKKHLEDRKRAHQAQREDYCDDRQAKPQQPPGDPVQPALEWRLIARSRLEPARDFTKLGTHPRGHN